MSDRWSVIAELLRERETQAKRGMDAEHDDRQSLASFAWLLSRRSNDLGAPNLSDISKDEPRRLLIEICAISMAAVESIDRKVAAAAAKAKAGMLPHGYRLDQLGHWSSNCVVCGEPEAALRHFQTCQVCGETRGFGMDADHTHS